MSIDFISKELQEIVKEARLIEDWEWDQNNVLAEALMVEGAATLLLQLIEDPSGLPDSVFEKIREQFQAPKD